MSPEQARGHSLDPRSDLFSLGVVMYEMATRRTPFRGTNSSQVFTQILEHEPEPVRNWNDTIPRDLEKIILKLLHKDRRQRYQNTLELIAALEKLTGRMTKGTWLKKNATPPVVPLVPMMEPVARTYRRNRRDPHIAASPLPARPDSGGSLHIRPLRSPAAETAARQVSPQSFVLTAPGSSADQVKDSSNARNVNLSGSGMSQFEFESETLPSIAVQETVLSPTPRPSPLRTWSMRAGILASIAAVIIAGIITLHGGHLSSTALSPNDVLLLTSIQDKTGDKLDGAVMDGLYIALSQTRAFAVHGESAYQAGLRQIHAAQNATIAPSPHAVAQQIGARAYLLGEINHSVANDAHSGYVIRIDALKAASNDRLVTLTEQAATRADIPAAIDRLAVSLRSELGEGKSSIAETSEPLSRQGSADMDALQAYSEANGATHSGHALDAIAAYRKAIAHDNQFTQAYLQLAWLYNTQHAEIAAAEAAKNAQSTIHTNDQKTRLLAEFTYAMIAAGDYGRALTTIRQFNQQFSDSSEGMVGLARVLRAQGHLVESLLAAQQAYEQDPLMSSAYTEAELDMIGLGRYMDALKLEQQAGSRGVLPSRAGIPASYLANRNDLFEQQTLALEEQGQAHRSPTPAELGAYAFSLDSSQKWDAAEQVWARAAAMASTVAGLQSASGYALNQAALDRAIASKCSDALQLLRMNHTSSLGPVATFRGGMAYALCGHTDEAQEAIAALDQLRSSGLTLAQYGPNELKAALAIQSKDSALAIQLLEGIDSQNDPSLLPYLRSLAYTSDDKMQDAADNLRSIVDHRGAVYLSGVSVYPQAQLTLSRTPPQLQADLYR
jgi:serine/threonine-protein kinase